MERSELISVLCLDVLHAFYRVDHRRFGPKQKLTPHELVRDCVSQVIVAGARSPAGEHTDRVFEGGICFFYNTFYRRAFCLTETVFADDFHCYRGFCRQKTAIHKRSIVQ